MSSVVYCITENCLCVGYLSCLKNKLHVHFEKRGFEKTSFNAVSGIGIPKQLMNIISCH